MLVDDEYACSVYLRQREGGGEERERPRDTALLPCVPVWVCVTETETKGGGSSSRAPALVDRGKGVRGGERERQR
jgi:hypothetical protein